MSGSGVCTGVVHAETLTSPVPIGPSRALQSIAKLRKNRPQMPVIPERMPVFHPERMPDPGADNQAPNPGETAATEQR